MATDNGLAVVAACAWYNTMKPSGRIFTLGPPCQNTLETLLRSL
jgi:hypothetical protein